MNITPHCYSLSEKVVAALIVTWECGAETIAVTIKKMQYIFALLISPRHISLLMFPSICITTPVKQHKSE